MTITVPITALGVIRATEALQVARNDLAQRHDRATRTVQIEVAQDDTVSETGATGQKHVVDLQV